MPTLTTFLQHGTGSPGQGSWEEQEIKASQIGNIEVKGSLFTIRMIPYIKKNPEDSIKSLLETINSKFVGDKINTEKSIAFLPSNNKISEKPIPFTVPTKKNKTSRHKHNKEAKYLYMEKHKTWLKEIEEDTKKWKDIDCSWIGRINIVKMDI